jgi:hypothetical protein
MIHTVAEYARDSGKMDAAQVDEILGTIERAMAEGTYLGLAPQFLVTASA